ncbi:ATP-binding protein [Pasteurella testudinis]|uniref:ATP-binding protein n=1 Tax=Pasteurella testudinis TaxID=761 RepID=UPI0040582B09
MSKQIIKTVEIQSGVSPDYLESTLTTDITVLESIFDLIDNSIDAARDHLISNKFEADKFGLPQDYSSYKISIRLGSNSICILDNCLGIDENSLSKKVFLTAGISNHKFGIGHYGLGLKRALLKFGNTFAMSSDNGNVAFKMHFNSEMIAGNKKFVAQAYNSNGFRKTLFIVSELKPSIIYEIKNKDWFENAVKMLGIRYAAYIAKGLKIILSNDYQHEIYRINGELPSLRTDSKIEPISKYLNIEGVNVYIDSGVHGSYYFPSEKDKHSIAMNKTLTDDFGLYFVCNDRVIVASSTANEYGWKTKWHSEYNGFVCIVRFVSEDSSKMPWNTMKTVLKTSSPMFVQVRNTLQPIADQYRQSAKKLYLNKNVNKKTAQTLKENNLTTSSLDLNEQQNKKKALLQANQINGKNPDFKTLEIIKMFMSKIGILFCLGISLSLRIQF